VETYRIGGMTCGGCARAVTKVIQRLDPNASVSVDLAGGTVSVGGNVTPEALASAIEAAGYQFER
jgi:copper chaperone